MAEQCFFIDRMRDTDFCVEEQTDNMTRVKTGVYDWAYDVLIPGGRGNSFN